MLVLLQLLGGIFSGYLTKLAINWVDIENFQLRTQNILLECFGGILWVWAFQNLPIQEATLFSLVSTIIIGIGLVDFYTFQIPLVFILAGFLVVAVAVILNVIFISVAFWGVIVGAVIPLLIMGAVWIITKRQGMGYGDIQMGIVLGAWLGPIRMALTLFGASVLSLITWIAVSLIHDFNKDRALPLAPFLAIAGIGIYVGSFYYPELFHLLIIK